MPRQAMIVAGEASGELYGARLAGELSSRYPGIRVFGMGGDRMRAQGVEILRRATPVVGIVEVFEHLRELRDSFRVLVEAIERRRPDVVVLIDFPDFNLRVAKRAREAGIPVMYYVSPQIWAWRKGRLRTISERANAMAVILPFEEALYAGAGLRCRYVGHPLVEELADFSLSRGEARRLLDIPTEAPVIALLPGSRSGEVRRHWNDLCGAAARLKDRIPDLVLTVPLAQGLPDAARDLVERNPAPGMRVYEGMAREVLRAADAAAIASGTAVLEAALIGTPAVVFYRSAALSYLIARLLVDLPFISLPNLITGKPVLKELIQHDMTPDGICAELLSLMNDGERRRDMLKKFGDLSEILGSLRASLGAADLAAEVAGW